MDIFVFEMNLIEITDYKLQNSWNSECEAIVSDLFRRGGRVVMGREHLAHRTPRPKSSK